MKTKILTLALMLLISFSGLEAKPKQEKVKIDPEFEQFWKSFKSAKTSNDKPWFENNTIFPMMTTGECEAMGGIVERKEFFENWYPVDKKESKKLSKIKLNQVSYLSKNEKTYSVLSDEGSDPAKNIPNGTPLIYVGYQDGICYQTYYFAKMNNGYKYLGYGSCCEGGY